MRSIGAVCSQNRKTTPRGTSHHILRIMKREGLLMVDINCYFLYKKNYFQFFIWVYFFFLSIKYFFTILFLNMKSGVIILLLARKLRLFINSLKWPIIQIQDFIMEKACPHLNVNISLIREMHSMKNRGKNK